MLPPRPPGVPNPKSGVIANSGGNQSFEAIKLRVLAKLEDRMDPSTSKRMPASLLRQSLRSFAEQIVEQEGRSLAKPDRDRLIDDVLSELLGYGPLEELFAEPAVREVMVLGPQAVIVRRDQGGWIPSHVRFRDEDHLNAALERLATHADPVGNMMASVNTFDLKLPNGFRVLAVVPPPGLSMQPQVIFVRVESAAAATAGGATAAGASGTNLPRTGSYQTGATPAGSGATRIPGLTPATGSASAGTRLPGMNPATGSASAGTRLPEPAATTPRTGSNVIGNPAARVEPPADPLSKHRNRIIERLISKLASLGVYDLSRLGSEMQRVVAAYVAEYIEAEKVPLTDAEQGRLTLEIITAMQR
jgi:hypothetical protein